MFSRPQREGLRFPILTLDERRLSPALGYIFDAKWIDPHESIVSILWKFAKANALPGHIVASLPRADADPYEGVEPTRYGVDLARLRANLPVPRKTLRSSLIPPMLYPASCRYLRYCPRCMSRGYHCVVHQFETIQHCPLHKCPLQVECLRCRYMAPYRLNALLLGSPYRCAQCRMRYGHSDFCIKSRRPLSKTARITLCRLHYRYFCF